MPLSTAQIFNLTKYPAKTDQYGLVDLPKPLTDRIHELSIFTECPTKLEMRQRAIMIKGYLDEILLDDSSDAKPYLCVGGAGFFLPTLINVLRDDYNVVFSFTKKKRINGEVIHSHEGWVES